MGSKLLVVGLFLAWQPWARAQATDPADRELIQKLLVRIDSLEKRVAELEKGNLQVQVGVPPPQPQPSPEATAAAIHAAHETAPIPDAARAEYPALKISGFSDLNFSSTDLRGPSGGFG